MKSRVWRLFGRKKPVHKDLGGGKRFFTANAIVENGFILFDHRVLRGKSDIMLMICNHVADIFLWRNKNRSAGVLGSATAIWILFELVEYHLVTLVCDMLILALAVLFLWSDASIFINKSPPLIPEVAAQEKCVVEIASALRFEVKRALAILKDIASGRELKKFLIVIAGLWIVSILGSWFNFVTLFYIMFILLFTVPVFSEKYEDHVDAFAEKAMVELKKQYVVLDEKVEENTERTIEGQEDGLNQLLPFYPPLKG